MNWSFIIFFGFVAWYIARWILQDNKSKEKQTEALIQELRAYKERSTLSEFSREYHYEGLLNKANTLPALKSVMLQWESVDHTSSQVDPHAMAETIVYRELLELEIPVELYSRNFVLCGLLFTFIGLAITFVSVSTGGFSQVLFFPGVGSAMGSTISFLVAAQYLNYHYRNYDGDLNRAKASLVQLLVSDSHKLVSADDAERSLSRLIALYQDVSSASKQAAEQVSQMSIATTSIMEGFQESIQRFLEATNSTSEIAKRVGAQQQAQFDREVQLEQTFSAFSQQVGQMGQHLSEQSSLTREMLDSARNDRDTVHAGIQATVQQSVEFKQSLDTYSQQVNQATTRASEIANQHTSALAMLKDGIDSLNKEVATFGASSVRLKDLIEQKIDSVESKELLLQMSNELQQQAELIHSLKGVGHNLSAVAQQMHEEQHAHNQSVPGVVAAMYEVQRSIAQTAMSLQQALQHAETPNYRSFFKRVFRRK